jgi:exonuclease III
MSPPNHNGIFEKAFVFVQETKIQDGMVEQYASLLEGYDAYWNCSTVKKGYAGTVRTPPITLQWAAVLLTLLGL